MAHIRGFSTHLFCVMKVNWCVGITNLAAGNLWNLINAKVCEDCLIEAECLGNVKRLLSTGNYILFSVHQRCSVNVWPRIAICEEYSDNIFNQSPVGI